MPPFVAPREDVRFRPRRRAFDSPCGGRVWIAVVYNHATRRYLGGIRAMHEAEVCGVRRTDAEYVSLFRLLKMRSFIAFRGGEPVTAHTHLPPTVLGYVLERSASECGQVLPGSRFTFPSLYWSAANDLHHSSH